MQQAALFIVFFIVFVSGNTQQTIANEIASELHKQIINTNILHKRKKIHNLWKFAVDKNFIFISFIENSMVDN